MKGNRRLLYTYYVPDIFTEAVFLSIRQVKLWGNKYPHFTNQETVAQRNNTPILPIRKLRLRQVRSNAQDLISK